jgi:hypothetical protein
MVTQLSRARPSGRLAALSWRSYGTEPLPTGREALDEPFRAFPSWFMRITCDRCGKDRMVSEAHMPYDNITGRHKLVVDLLSSACRGGPRPFHTVNPMPNLSPTSRCGDSLADRDRA